MSERLNPIKVRFWQSANGREPVRDFLRGLSKPDRLRLGEDISRLQFGWPIGMPLVRNMGSGLWELRSSLPGRKEVRILFAAADGVLVLLNVFVKKSQKTPAAEIDLARDRMKELLS